MRFLILLALMTASARGQDLGPVRIRTLGEVTSSTGEPWPGARVMVISLRPDSRLGKPDVVEVRTRDNGRFAVRLRADRVYSAWALSKDGELTGLVRDIAVGDRIQLVECGEQPVSPTIEVEGLDRWGSDVTLTVRDQIGRRIPITLDAKRRAELPKLPGDACAVEFSKPSSGRFFAQTVCLTEEARHDLQFTRWLDPGARRDKGIERVRVPPPVQLNIRVIDEAEQPIPGALATCVIGSPLGWSHVVARSDGQGRAKMRVPRWLVRSRPWVANLTLTAAGFGIVKHTIQVPLIDTRPPERRAEPATEDVTVTLAKGYACRGIVTDNGVPVAGARIVYRMEWTYHQHFVATDSRGRWSIPGLGKDARWLDVALVLPETRSANSVALPESRLARLRGGGILSMSGDLVLAPVDLAKIRNLDLHVQLADGSPAAFATVEELGPFTRGSRPDKHDPTSVLWDTIRCDRQGRCRVRVTRDEVSLAIHAEDYYLHQVVDVTKAANPLVLTLTPYAKVEGTVISADEKPLAGIVVHCAGHNWGKADFRFEQFCAFNNHAKRLTDITDAQGRFQLRFIPAPGRTLSLIASKRAGRKVYFSNTAAVTGSKAGLELVLDLPHK